jgi:hypothetical protein
MHYREIAAALIARERFRLDAPGWPELPVHEDVCMRMQRDVDDPNARLVGYYGASLHETDPAFDYDAHPPFDTYVRGLMAYDHTPAEIQDDPDLRAEFPAVPLDGLQDGWMRWRTAEQIAFDRDMTTRIAAREAEGW